MKEKTSKIPDLGFDDEAFEILLEFDSMPCRESMNNKRSSLSMNWDRRKKSQPPPPSKKRAYN